MPPTHKEPASQLLVKYRHSKALCVKYGPLRCTAPCKCCPLGRREVPTAYALQSLSMQGNADCIGTCVSSAQRTKTSSHLHMSLHKHVAVVVVLTEGDYHLIGDTTIDADSTSSRSGRGSSGQLCS